MTVGRSSSFGESPSWLRNSRSPAGISCSRRGFLRTGAGAALSRTRRRLALASGSMGRPAAMITIHPPPRLRRHPRPRDAPGLARGSLAAGGNLFGGAPPGRLGGLQVGPAGGRCLHPRAVSARDETRAVGTPRRTGGATGCRIRGGGNRSGTTPRSGRHARPASGFAAGAAGRDALDARGRVRDAVRFSPDDGRLAHLGSQQRRARRLQRGLGFHRDDG